MNTARNKQGFMATKCFATCFSILAILVIMCGCSYEKDSSNKGYATVYIEGKPYDLTQDFDTLTSQWAGQGYYVCTGFAYDDSEYGVRGFVFLPDGTLTDALTIRDRFYEENESFRRIEFRCIGGLDRPEDEIDYIMASAKQFSIRFDEGYPTSINNRYSLGDDMMELYSFRYEMDNINNTNECIKQLRKNGIDNLIELSERCIFKGYYTVASNADTTSQLIAVFYDGEPVDIEAYMPEDLQSAYNECREMKYGLLNHHPLFTTYPYIMDGNLYKGYDYSDIYYESVGLECAFNYAYQKGAEKILSGEITEVVAVSFYTYQYRVTVMKADDLLLNYDKETDKAYFQ